MALGGGALCAMPGLVNGAQPLWQPYNPPKNHPKYPPILGMGEKKIDLLPTIKGQHSIVNFWATWCEPCLRELPIFNQLAQSPPVVGLQIITINIDISQYNAHKFINEQMQLKSLTQNYGGGQKLMNMMGFNALPTTFFVHKNGQIKGYAQGFRHWQNDEWNGIFKILFG